MFINKMGAYKFVLITAVLSSLILSGCGKEKSETKVESPVEVLLVTDYGTINDGSFNQGTWEGIEDFSNATGALIDHYQPVDSAVDSYLEQIKRGEKNGAQVIVCAGNLCESAIYKAQSKYSDIKFVLVDGQPKDEGSDEVVVKDNTVAITFAEEQAGFLAGYAAVRDGYTGLGFMGGVPDEAVIRYGYGFVQGADYAAIEMGTEVHIRYVYMNTYGESPIIEATAGAWYDDDTEVIFACGGSLGRSVIHAAEDHDGKVIGVDVDQSGESERVITSAMKSLSAAVYSALIDYSTGAFKGGQTVVFDASQNGVCLPMDSSRFVKFTQDDYQNIYSRLVDGHIVPYNGTDIGTTQELTLVNTTVTYIRM